MSYSTSTKTEAAQLVDKLLDLVKDTRLGARSTPSNREQIDSTIRTLSQLGKSQTPMQDPRLFSCYEVAYSSPSKGRAPSAGGLFTSAIGRVLFIPRGLFQHVLLPDMVINLVCFRLFGFINGCVGLRGKIEPLNSRRLGPNAIMVKFQQPRIRFGKAVFQFGPRSNVQLATTYLDDRVRIAVGGRGGQFVFTKGGAAEWDLAQEWEPLFRAQTLPTALLPGTIAVVVGLAAFLTPWYVKVVTVILATMLGYVLNRGGTLRGPNAP